MIDSAAAALLRNPEGASSDPPGVHEFAVHRRAGEDGAPGEIEVLQVLSAFLAPPELYLGGCPVTDLNAEVRARLAGIAVRQQLFAGGFTPSAAEEIPSTRRPPWYQGSEFELRVLKGYQTPHQEGGEAAAAVVLGAWNLPVEDLQRATEEAIRLEYADPERMSIVGGSYRAYLGACLAGAAPLEGRAERSYRAAVLHAGVHGPIHQFASDAYWVQPDQFGARPWPDARGHSYYRNRSRQPGEPESVAERADAPGDPADWEGHQDWAPFERISVGLSARRERLAAVRVLLTHGLDELRVPWTQSVFLHRMLLD